MMIVLMGGLCFASVFFLSLYLGNFVIENQIIKYRIAQLKQISASRGSASLLKNNSWLKKMKSKLNLENANLKQVATYLFVWPVLNLAILGVPMPLGQKVVIATLMSVIMLRLIKIITLRKRQEQLRKELPGVLDLIDRKSVV
jgi:Flp pilus assembly protein TadB